MAITLGAFVNVRLRDIVGQFSAQVPKNGTPIDEIVEANIKSFTCALESVTVSAMQPSDIIAEEHDEIVSLDGISTASRSI